MKKIVSILFALTALFAFTQMAVADTVKLIDPSIYHSGNGGEFTMLASGSTLPGLVNFYDAKTKNVNGTSSTFQTFCIEESEYISYGGTYDAILNNKAINGGAGPAGDPISKGTAYLYYQFAKGTLAGYNYGSGRATSAGDLQNAIWFLEGEGGVNNAYVTLVAGLFEGLAGAEADNDGLYGVGVLNLYAEGHAENSEYRHQDVLILTPEPMTMLLLGLGLVGLAGLRRKE